MSGFECAFGFRYRFRFARHQIGSFSLMREFDSQSMLFIIRIPPLVHRGKRGLGLNLVWWVASVAVCDRTPLRSCNDADDHGSPGRQQNVADRNGRRISEHRDHAA